MYSIDFALDMSLNCMMNVFKHGRGDVLGNVSQMAFVQSPTILIELSSLCFFSDNNIKLSNKRLLSSATCVTMHVTCVVTNVRLLTHVYNVC